MYSRKTINYGCEKSRKKPCRWSIERHAHTRKYQNALEPELVGKNIQKKRPEKRRKRLSQSIKRKMNNKGMQDTREMELNAELRKTASVEAPNCEDGDGREMKTSWRIQRLGRAGSGQVGNFHGPGPTRPGLTLAVFTCSQIPIQL